MAPVLSKLAISAVSVLLLSELEKTRKRRRRVWESSFLRSRNYTQLLADLKADKTRLFENFSRMSSVDFDFILHKIEDKVSRKDTNLRESIPASVQLAITLRFLATGDSYASLMYLFRVSRPSISRIVPEVCQTIVEALKDYVKKPENEEEWQCISQGFEQKWNFPHVVGAIDGKHVVIQCPRNSGSEYFNYSIVLFALVDADYNFIYVDIGCRGRTSDGGVFKNSQLYKDLQDGLLNLPPPSKLHSGQIPVPYVILGDDAFGLSDSLMKPYSGYYAKGCMERVFNYRLSRARRVVENAFGILSSVFRVLRKPLLIHPERASLIVLACVYLHNFLRQSKTSSNLYCPAGALDTDEDGDVTPGTWRNEQNLTSLLDLKEIPKREKSTAKDVREVFSKYFMTNGAVPWQTDYS